MAAVDGRRARRIDPIGDGGLDAALTRELSDALDVCRVPRPRVAPVGPRPWGLSPDRPRGVRPGGTGVVRVLDWPRSRLYGVHLCRLRAPLAWPGPAPRPHDRGPADRGGRRARVQRGRQRGD